MFLNYYNDENNTVKIKTKNITINTPHTFP